MTISDLILILFHGGTAAHVIHLRTNSYAEHKTLEKFYEQIVDIADELAEVYSGDYGTPKFTLVPYKDYTDSIELMDDLREAVDTAAKTLHPEDTHLNNICDELRALIARTRRLLRMK